MLNKKLRTGESHGKSDVNRKNNKKILKFIGKYCNNL